MHSVWQAIRCTLALALLCHAKRSPSELQVIRDSATGLCESVSLHETQVHKGLDKSLAHGEQYIIETSKFTSGLPEHRVLERIRVFSYNKAALRDHARSYCDQDERDGSFTTHDTLGGQRMQDASQIFMQSGSHDIPPLEIHPLIQSGPSDNRVDLVFFADGYTLDEKPKFLADASRLADDISKNQTFYTVRPLLNIWAAFTPSVESGIGVGGLSKNTTFGLFRDGTELRGVYYNNPDVARAACASLGSQCDYPILMGNDPFYGGLGGEFTVITPSVLNGALVLRHELGHSIIEVGEEYDGGFAYFGCNAAQKPENIGWTQWLTDPTILENSDDTARVERAIMSIQQYPWTILNNTYSVDFSSTGTYPFNRIRFSISGIPKSDQLSVLLDGKDLGWEVQKDVGIDRYFYDFLNLDDDAGLSEGDHTIEFVLNYPPATVEIGGGPQLCSVEVLEYGWPDEFNSSAGYYGIFPTFSETNETSYRPTNEDCLMRQVTSPNFCKVCTEGLWLSLMNRVDIIDQPSGYCHQDHHGRWKRTLEVELLPLAEYRSNETVVDKEEAYEITWSRTRGDIQPQSLLSSEGMVWVERRGALVQGKKEVFYRSTNSTKLVLDELRDDVQVGDIISVDVTFFTEEVKVDEDGFLSGGGDWVIRKRCGG